MKFSKKSILRGLSLCLAGLMCLSATACGRAWAYLWDRTEASHAGGEQLVIPGTDHAEDTYIPFEGAVEYDPDEVHEGTDIYYVGTGDRRSKIIVIDAGHQAEGSDINDTEPLGPGSSEMKQKVTWGATGAYTGTEEHVLTLEVALKLRDELMARGYSVVMIRETADVNISNMERALIANKYDAAAFVRIHANSWEDESMNGTITICQSESNPFPACAAHYEQSRLMSECILRTFCEATGLAQNGIREMDNMTGTNWSEVPSTIVEMGFLSNAADDRRMKVPYFWEQAAEGIADGLDAYFVAMGHLELQDDTAAEGSALTDPKEEPADRAEPEENS